MERQRYWRHEDPAAQGKWPSEAPDAKGTSLETLLQSLSHSRNDPYYTQGEPIGLVYTM